MDAGLVSPGSNAPRGADSRYTTDRRRSGRSRSGGAPRSETPGRRSTVGATRPISTRPRMAPLRGAGCRGACGATRSVACGATTKDTKDTKETTILAQTASTGRLTRCTRDRCVLCVLCGENISEPEGELSGHEPRRPSPAAVARVELRRDFQEQIPFDGIPAADLEPAHRRVPGGGPLRTGDVVEAQTIAARGDIKAGTNLVARFNRGRGCAQRSADGG